MLLNVGMLLMHYVMKLDWMPVSFHNKLSLNFKYELVQFLFGSSMHCGSPVFVQFPMLYLKSYVMDFAEGRNPTDLMQIVNFTRGPKFVIKLHQTC